MSATISVRSASVSFGAQTVLADVDLVVGPGDRIGVVAPNGVGKSTLLRVLAGELTPESGSVVRAPAATTVVRLTQEPEILPGETLRGHLARRTGVAAARTALDSAAAALATGAVGAGDAYSQALDAWLALGGADIEERAGQVIAVLGLSDDLLADGRNATELSGGQRARLALAVALLAQPDILLLDEPTNDLDDDGLDRLEPRVRTMPAGIVVVSHDRAFLAATVTRIVEIDEFTRRLTEYRGGWQSYVDERAAARRRAVQARAEYETERGRLLDAARRQREWARAGAQRAANPRYTPDNDKSIRHGRIEGAQRLAAGATRTERAIERLDAEAPEVVRAPWRLRLTIAPAARPGEIVVELRDAVVERGDVRLGPFQFSLASPERVRLTGPNGSGKTTLVDALLGRQSLRAGSRYVGPSVVFGELDQTRRIFDTAQPVAEVVRQAAAAPEGRGSGHRLGGVGSIGLDEVRTLLAKFRLGGDSALRPARTLSPGERTRAGLAVLQARGVNCLVLDEPTNHLDIEAIEQVEAALAEFRGALVLVTHDRRLAAAVPVDRAVDVRDLVPDGCRDRPSARRAR
jgi:ATPase subunit of ABC transporter with duplicated ATPase domains